MRECSSADKLSRREDNLFTGENTVNMVLCTYDTKIIIARVNL